MPRKVTCPGASKPSSSPAGVQARKRTAGRRSIGIALLLLLGLTVARPCPGADNRFEVMPRWVRPDGTVTVKLSAKVDTGKKLFLRLTAHHTVKELPIDSELGRRGFAEVRIPSPLRRGTYKTELVSEGGEVLAVGPEELKVGAAEKPSITAVWPSVSYGTDGTHDFELIGENFSHYNADDVDVRINDVRVDFLKRINDKKGEMSAKDCNATMPCLIWNWRTLRIFGASLEKLRVHRPLQIRVEVDQLISDPQPLRLSCVQRHTPRAAALLVLAVSGAVVYLLARRTATQYRSNGRSYTTLTYLLIDPQTNTYSLSKLQLLIWTAAAVVAYTYLAASQFFVQWKWVLPTVPEGLPMLLGLSATTSAIAVGATEARGCKGAGPVHPCLGDFVTTGGVFAPERFQFFLWTILGAVGFVSATLAQDPGTVNEMAQIPANFNPLMGASSLGYLAGKFARKPGPVIKQLDPVPPYPSPAFDLSKGIRIVGENLSPNAQVRLNGVLLATDQVERGAQQSKTEEFVSELVLMPKKVESAPAGVMPIKITNPDGQSAEMGGPAVSDR